MRLLAPGSASADVDRLFASDVPTRPRALAVLDGVLTGHVWTDDERRPTWVIAIETADGTVYAGGALTPSLLLDVLRGVETRSGDLIFGFAGEHDPLRELLPEGPYHRGEAIDFTDRVPPADEAQLLTRLPADVRLVRIDEQLLPLTEWYRDTLLAFGSVERWRALAVGYAAMRDGEMLADSVAGPRSRGILEMGVATREAHRRQGLGTAVSRQVAIACEAAGDRVWWNTSADNLPSIAIARHLGFSHERRYELVAYRTESFGR